MRVKRYFIQFKVLFDYMTKFKCVSKSQYVCIVTKTKKFAHNLYRHYDYIMRVVIQGPKPIKFVVHLHIILTVYRTQIYVVTLFKTYVTTLCNMKFIAQNHYKYYVKMHPHNHGNNIISKIIVLVNFKSLFLYKFITISI